MEVKVSKEIHDRATLEVLVPPKVGLPRKFCHKSINPLCHCSTSCSCCSEMIKSSFKEESLLNVATMKIPLNWFTCLYAYILLSLLS